ncbi:hypothetical protein IKQ21_03175 [bacterium]|nr:hypothetical protein [bacterium]
MTTPYGRQYLNMYLNQANPFAMTGMSGFGISGYSSNYCLGATVAQYGMGIASIFTQALICRMSESRNAGGNYGGGGGGSYKSDIETKVEKQLDLLGEEYDVNNYTTAKVEQKYDDAVNLANENINTLKGKITTDKTSLASLSNDIDAKKADLAKIQDKESTEYYQLEREIKNLEENYTKLKASIEANEAKLADGGELANAKKSAVEAQSNRRQQIENAKAELGKLIPKLKEEKANPVTMDAELNYSDGNWLQRIGGGKNAQARQAIRDFRKAKQDYDAMPDGPMKDEELKNLKEIANKALTTTDTCDIKNLDGSVKSGLAFIRNWYDIQK